MFTNNRAVEAHQDFVAAHRDFLVVEQYASGAPKVVMYGIDGDHWVLHVEYDEHSGGYHAQRRPGS